ncbi:uncharacterized protein RB166_000142 [Leptodactylus fuscus]
MYGEIPSPTLMRSPVQGFYYKGESVTLTCETPRKYRHSHFTFYKNSEYIETDNTYVYKIYGMELSDVGTYTCDFWSVRQSSPRSNEVTLFFSDRLSPPVISISPSLSMYNMGESVTIVCSPPGSLILKKIKFYKDGNVQPIKEAENNTFVISTSNKDVAGRYSCTYTANIQETLRTSSYSEYIIVNVSAVQTTTSRVFPESPALGNTSKTSNIETFTPTKSNDITDSAKFLKILIYSFHGGLIFTFVLTIGLLRLCIRLNGEREDIVTEPSMTFVPLSPLLPAPGARSWRFRNRKQAEVKRSSHTCAMERCFSSLLPAFHFAGASSSSLVKEATRSRRRGHEHWAGDIGAESQPDLISAQNLKTIVQPSLCVTALEEIQTQHFYSEIEMFPVNVHPPVVSVYASATAIDPLPPVYQSDLTTLARN